MIPAVAVSALALAVFSDEPSSLEEAFERAWLIEDPNVFFEAFRKESQARRSQQARRFDLYEPLLLAIADWAKTSTSLIDLSRRFNFLDRWHALGAREPFFQASGMFLASLLNEWRTRGVVGQHLSLCSFGGPPVSNMGPLPPRKPLNTLTEANTFFFRVEDELKRLEEGYVIYSLNGQAIPLGYDEDRILWADVTSTYRADLWHLERDDRQIVTRTLLEERLEELRSERERLGRELR